MSGQNGRRLVVARCVVDERVIPLETGGVVRWRWPLARHPLRKWSPARSSMMANPMHPVGASLKAFAAVPASSGRPLELDCPTCMN
jgi:hypothetical protein